MPKLARQESVSVLMAPAAKPFLTIGDLIMLEDPVGRGMATAQGFRDVNVYLHTDEVNMHESLYLVRPQQNYVVAKQLRALVEREGMTAQAPCVGSDVGQMRQRNS